MGFFGNSVSVLLDGQIYGELRQMVEREPDSLLLVTPYIEFNEDFVRLLDERARAKVKVQILFRADKEDEYVDQPWFERLQAAGVSFRKVDYLHAKLYISSEFVLASSMNLTEYSWNNSREFGLKLKRGDAAGNELMQYGDKLFQASTATIARATGSTGRKHKKSSSADGFCIRCADPIPLNPQRPYCKPDYEKWAEYENRDFKDKYCHECGTATAATMNKPLCRDCFKAA